MTDLRKTISEAAKKMWAEMDPIEKKRRLSLGGKNGTKNRWARMTPKERMLVITRMNKARLTKKKTV